MSIRLIMRWSAMLIVSALLGGCALRPQLHSVAIDHNRLVADTANELALLNILRARDRQPMHFTSMTVLRGNTQMSVGGEIGGLFLGDDLQTISPSVSAGAVSNPSFDIAVYDKQEFQNGIMRPVEPRLYQYFLSTGRPPDYLARLLIERIEFRTDGSNERPAGVLVGALENDPDNAEKAAQFTHFLAQYDVEVRTSRGPPTPLAVASELLGRSSLEELAIFAEGHLYIEKEGEDAGMIMRPGDVEHEAVLVETDPAAGSAYACPPDGGPIAGGENSSRSLPASFQIFVGDRAHPVTDACTFNGTSVAPPLIVLRSPDAVIYYLGEYLRDPTGRDEAKLLKVWGEGESGAQGRREVVHTRFMGQRYAILEEPDGPDGRPTGRSMQTLAFVQQLINLHKSADELPDSTSLTVQR